MKLILVPALLAFVTIIASACSSPIGPCDGCGTPILDPISGCNTDAAPADGKPTYQVGDVDNTGAFVPFASGQTVKVQFGGQGGRHVWASLRLFAPPAADPWAVTLTIEDPANGIAFAETEVAVPTCPDGWSTIDQITVVISGEVVSPATLKVDATPPGGAVIHVEVPLDVQE